MSNSKDILLLLIVTFITMTFILPEGSILRGLDRSYMLIGLLIIVTIALSHYSKIVVFSAVTIVAIGANLPQDIAGLLNIDVRVLMVALITLALVAIANQVFRLPTGLDKAQGFPTGKASSTTIVELNSVEIADPESHMPENSDAVHDPAMKAVTSG